MLLKTSTWFSSQDDDVSKNISRKFQLYVGKGNLRFFKLWMILSAMHIHYAIISNLIYLTHTRRQGAVFNLGGYILSEISQLVALYTIFFRRKQIKSLLVKLFIALDASDKTVLQGLFRKHRLFVTIALILGTLLAIVGALDIMNGSADSHYFIMADYYCFVCDPNEYRPLTMLQSRIVTSTIFTFYSYCVIGCGILIASFYAFVCMAIISIAERFNKDLATLETRDQFGPFLGTLRSRLRQLNGLIEEANSILQNIVLLWYVITLLHTCSGVTEGIKRAGSTTILNFVYHLILNSGDLVTLTTVTYYASKIPDVLAESFDYVPVLAEHAISAGYQAEINLLYNQMWSMKNGIRLGGCFVITKNFFVSFMGVAITYAVIYIQLNPDVLYKLQNLGSNSTRSCTCSVL